MSLIDVLYDDRNEKKFYNYGVAVGVVVNTKDPEKLGRVKVKLYTRDVDDNMTDWIRVMSPYAGAKKGFYFLPEVDDEVLLAFCDGDINRPYVLGTLWNSKDKPPDENAEGKNEVKMIKTKNGNQIIFKDIDDKESIEIMTKKQLTVSLNDENEKIDIKDKSGKNILTIDSKKGEIQLKAETKLTISIGSGNTVTIDGNANGITMESGTSFKIKSQQINIEAQGAMTLKSAGMLDVKSDGVINVKGSLVKIN